MGFQTSLKKLSFKEITSNMFTPADIDLIRAAKNEGVKIWENDKIKPIKDKIKKYFRAKRDQCCYCQREFGGEFPMVIDIEHILPKSDNDFKIYMFHLHNLNISCKRCNMRIKGVDISFISSREEIISNPFVSRKYKFIHPNLDNYKTHINRIIQINDNIKLIKYNVLTNDKGQYTYDYFKLKELEINQINEAQGVHQSKISNDISDEIISEIANILKG